ncbi:MAG: ImmA/IrrE family metallo-endopeptidase [Clostridia bacterium]|nr:ImmA/IrrE family metallo-endopeptidase [Clostridia bacterium]
MLYNHIDNLKYELGLDMTDISYPIDSKKLAKKYCKNVHIDEIAFPSQYICGILYKGSNSTSIALNANREKYQQNFDCMHELIHYFFHDISYCQLMCSDKSIQQDSYIEWQANEGAAQFLVPYQLFIPKYLELEKKYAHSNWEDDSIEELAQYFNVSYGVISNRINSLETEIFQYKKGQSINSLVVLSKTKAISLGLGDLKVKQLYCKKCLNVVNKHINYCPICGNNLNKRSFFMANKREGAGFMIYKKEIETDKDNKVTKCPRCDNEEVSYGDYCKICGLELYNRCTNYETDGYGNMIGGCGEACDSNARYCPICGSKTSFYTMGILSDYTSEKDGSHNIDFGITVPISSPDDLPF